MIFEWLEKRCHLTPVRWQPASQIDKVSCDTCQVTTSLSGWQGVTWHLSRDDVSCSCSHICASGNMRNSYLIPPCLVPLWHVSGDKLFTRRNMCHVTSVTWQLLYSKTLHAVAQEPLGAPSPPLVSFRHGLIPLGGRGGEECGDNNMLTEQYTKIILAQSNDIRMTR